METLTPAPLVGCCVGDMVGKFAETKPANEIEWDGETVLPGNYRYMKGVYYSPDELLNRVGVPTDDSQMSRILGSVLRQKGTYDPELAAKGYADWLAGKSYVGAPRGIGGTLKKSITRLLNGATWQTCGERLDPHSYAGTGTAMRAGVLGCQKSLVDVIAAAEVDARITHDHDDAVAGSTVMAMAVHMAMEQRGSKSQSFIFKLRDELIDRKQGHTRMAWALRAMCLAANDYDTYSSEFTRRHQVAEDVLGIVTTALVCCRRATSFQEGIVAAVRMGGDTDTRAAMVGVILGAAYGLEGIPKSWLDVLYEREIVEAEDRDLVQLYHSGP